MKTTADHGKTGRTTKKETKNMESPNNKSQAKRIEVNEIASSFDLAVKVA